MSYGNNFNRIARIISDTLRKVSKVSEGENVNVDLNANLNFNLTQISQKAQI